MIKLFLKFMSDERKHKLIEESDDLSIIDKQNIINTITNQEILFEILKEESELSSKFKTAVIQQKITSVEIRKKAIKEIEGLDIDIIISSFSETERREFLYEMISYDNDINNVIPKLVKESSEEELKQALYSIEKEKRLKALQKVTKSIKPVDVFDIYSSFEVDSSELDSCWITDIILSLSDEDKIMARLTVECIPFQDRDRILETVDEDKRLEFIQGKLSEDDCDVGTTKIVAESIPVSKLQEFVSSLGPRERLRAINTLFIRHFDKMDVILKIPEIADAYETFIDETVQDRLYNFISLSLRELLENRQYIQEENIQRFVEMAKSLSILEKMEDSSEIFMLKGEIIEELENTENPIETLKIIGQVFQGSNIPTFAKMYRCFELLHLNSIDFQRMSYQISPVLSDSSAIKRRVIIYSDLIKTEMSSNNRTIHKFLEDIEAGNELYQALETGKLKFEELDDSQKDVLASFSNTLAVMYDNSMRNKGKENTFKQSNDVFANIKELKTRLSPNGKLDYKLDDRVIRMLCGFMGINTIEQAKEWMKSKIKDADEKNRKASNSEMQLEQGDFIKGIGKVGFLREIFQNGSVAREYLGSGKKTDATPLDTDVSMINTEGTTREKIENTVANGYGPIYFVLKKDERFQVTRTEDGKKTDIDRDMSKLEVYYTGVMGKGHYGIRTGFSSSDVDYIVMDNYDERVGLEIALNGFYIPVANKDGKIIFSPKQYEEIRAKMEGLSYEDAALLVDRLSKDIEEKAKHGYDPTLRPKVAARDDVRSADETFAQELRDTFISKEQTSKLEENR